MVSDNRNQPLSEAMRRYHEPPETPRDEMWAQIQSARQKFDGTAPSHTFHRAWWRRLVPLNRRLLWPATAAATLLIGIMLGRLFFQPDSGPVPPFTNPLVVEDAIEAPAGNRLADIYQAAAVPVFDHAETLLTQYRAGQISQPNGTTFTDRAASLLAETRLLRESPAAEDPDLYRLLSDLELTLTQIVQSGASRRPEERNWIVSGLDGRSMLNRLRSATTRDPRHSL